VIRCFKIQRENERAVRGRSDCRFRESSASYARPALIIARLAESRLGLIVKVRSARPAFPERNARSVDRVPPFIGLVERSYGTIGIDGDVKICVRWGSRDTEHCFKTARYHSHVTVCQWIYREGDSRIYTIRMLLLIHLPGKYHVTASVGLRFIKFSNA